MTQTPENPQAAQINVIHRHSRIRTAVMASMAAATFALAGAVYKGCGEDEVRIEAEATMEHLAASRAQPFIEYGGKTSASAYKVEKVWGWVPGIGGDEIPLTKAESSAVIGGVAELRTDRDAFLKWENHEDGGADIEVDADKVYIQYSTAVQMKDEKPVADSKLQPLAITTGDGILDRGYIGEEGARRAFVYRCGKIAVNTLPAGVKLFVHDIKQLVADGRKPASATKEPGGVSAAEIEAFKKIKVTFMQSVPGPGGSLIKKEVDPSDIKLKMRDMSQWPPKIIPITPDVISLRNLETRNNVKIVPGGKCKMNEESLRALDRLTGKPTTPGV